MLPSFSGCFDIVVDRIDHRSKRQVRAWKQVTLTTVCMCLMWYSLDIYAKQTSHTVGDIIWKASFSYMNGKSSSPLLSFCLISSIAVTAPRIVFVREY